MTRTKFVQQCCIHKNLQIYNINWRDVQRKNVVNNVHVARYVKFKGNMTKWPVQKITHRTTQKHVDLQHHDTTDI